MSEIPVPVVNIQPVTFSEREVLIGDKPLGVHIGHELDEQAVAQDRILNELLGRLKDEADELYLLSWNGGKIPRGAEINGKEIGWTQHGIVTSVDGEELGYYDRLLEYGGESGRDQQILVYTQKSRSRDISSSAS